MINKRNIIIILAAILITILLIIIMLDIYFFKWHQNSFFLNDLINKNNNVYEKTKFSFMNDKANTENKTQFKNEPEKFKNETDKTNNQESEKNKNTNQKVITENIEKEKIYAKGSNLPDQKFHSFGEYITIEEMKYRKELVKNLKIKTIVIDKLTKGNGISQEYFKIAYLNKMIPAKILEVIVESEEFRDLIPKKFLTDEVKIKGLSKGSAVIIKNESIIEILDLWTLGRLTPVQKAWSVHAIK
jgi:hypothetical protein